MTTLTEEKFKEILAAQIASAILPLQAELKAVKADLLSLADENQRIKTAMTTGHGLLRNDNQITADDLRAHLPERVEAASLEEIVLFTAAQDGVDLTTPAEIDRYFARAAERRNKQ